MKELQSPTPQLRELLEVVRYADYPGDADKAVEDIVALFSETAPRMSVHDPRWTDEIERTPDKHSEALSAAKRIIAMSNAERHVSQEESAMAMYILSAPSAKKPTAAEQELSNIANAKRFDREFFQDDTAFADWAQSRCRHTLASTDGGGA